MKVFLAIVALIAGYLVFINNPQWYFRKHSDEGKISIRHSDNIDYDFKTILPEISAALKRSSLYKEDYAINIYVTRSAGELFFFAPLCRGKRFCLNPYANAAYVAPVVSVDGSLRFPRWEMYEPKYEIIKAAVLPVMAQSDSALGFFFMSEWRKIGYPEYIADEAPRYMENEFCSKKTEPAFKEFEIRLCVRYMIENMRLPVETVLKGNYTVESVAKEAGLVYCRP